MTENENSESLGLLSDWKRIIFLACCVFTVVAVISSFLRLLPSLYSNIFAILAVIAGGSPILLGGLRALYHRHLDVDFLASIAIIGAVIVNQYIAAAVVALMLTGGELLEDYTANRTSKAIQTLIQSTPKTARVRVNGSEVVTPIEKVNVGDIVLVKPGEKIPVDGLVISGLASVNQAAITGESIPVEKTINSQVLTGTLIELGALEIRVSKVGEDTTFAHIIKLIKEGQENRAPIEKIADRYAQWFAPILLSIVVISYVITRNVIAAVSTLIIACPCALTLATPTAVVASIGNAAKKGILIRGGAALEKVGSTDTVILDKTGTITIGAPKVVDVKTFTSKSETHVVRLAAIAEKFSEHPLAKAVLAKADELDLQVSDPSTFQVLPGQGVIAQYENEQILVGNEKLLECNKVGIDDIVEETISAQESLGRTVFIVCENGFTVGLISVADTARKEATESIGELRKLGVKNVVMLTGDNSASAGVIAKEVGVDDVGSGLLPNEKVEYVNKYKAEGDKILMVGDGVNDAPALANAHVGIAMGKAGTDVAIETADIVLISDDLSKIPQIVETGKRTTKMIKQNIIIAMSVNVIGVCLAATGHISPILAAGIHEGNALFVVLNSTRLLWMK